MLRISDEKDNKDQEEIYTQPTLNTAASINSGQRTYSGAPVYSAAAIPGDFNGDGIPDEYQINLPPGKQIFLIIFK